jgi:extradiol dioxygenase family protein
LGLRWSPLLARALGLGSPPAWARWSQQQQDAGLAWLQPPHLGLRWSPSLARALGLGSPPAWARWSRRQQDAGLAWLQPPILGPHHRRR